MKTIICSLTIMVGLGTATTAKAICTVDPSVIESIPDPLPDEYDLTPHAVVWCAQLASCGPVDQAQCVGEFLANARVPVEPAEPTAPVPTGSGPGSTLLTCEQSLEEDAGQVACNGCEPPVCVPTTPPPQCGPWVDNCGNPGNAGGCADGQCVGGTCSPICGPTQPWPHWGVRDGECLQSCGGLGGTAASGNPCSNHGWTDVGRAYDTAYCCAACVSSSTPPQCGPWTDSCNNPQDAGGCPAPFQCTSGTCTCTSGTVVPECGLYLNGCGILNDAGECPFPFLCLGNVCMLEDPPEDCTYCHSPTPEGPFHGFADLSTAQLPPGHPALW